MLLADCPLAAGEQRAQFPTIRETMTIVWTSRGLTALTEVKRRLARVRPPLSTNVTLWRQWNWILSAVTCLAVLVFLCDSRSSWRFAEFLV